MFVSKAGQKNHLAVDWVLSAARRSVWASNRDRAENIRRQIVHPNMSQSQYILFQKWSFQLNKNSDLFLSHINLKSLPVKCHSALPLAPVCGRKNEFEYRFRDSNKLEFFIWKSVEHQSFSIHSCEVHRFYKTMLENLFIIAQNLLK